jgi:hypothetical protein
MAQASITITDDQTTGELTVSADFGDKIDETSRAHGMVMQLLEAVVGTAKTFTKIEDTVPEVDAEPSRIITN